MPELKEWRKGDPLLAKRFENMRQAIISTLVGGNGVHVRMAGNKVVIEGEDGINRHINQIAPIQQLARVPFYNDSGEDIPANSFLLIDGFTDEGTVKIIKPDADSISPARLLVSGNEEVAAGEFGTGWSADFSKSFVKYDDSSTYGVPEADDEFGTIADSWEGGVGNEGFKVAAVYDTEGQIAYIAPFRQHDEQYWFDSAKARKGVTNNHNLPENFGIARYDVVNGRGYVGEQYYILRFPIPDGRTGLFNMGAGGYITPSMSWDSWGVHEMTFDYTLNFYGFDEELDLSFTWATRPMGTLIGSITASGSWRDDWRRYPNLIIPTNIVELDADGFDVKTIRVAFDYTASVASIISGSGSVSFRAYNYPYVIYRIYQTKEAL